MNYFEAGPFPGIPFLAAAAFTCLAIAVSYRIPDEEEYQNYLDSKQLSMLEDKISGQVLLEKSRLLNEQGTPNDEDILDEDDTFKWQTSES